MNSCVFCAIVSGSVPSYKIKEDKEFVAFLGIFPKFPGMTVVARKKHTNDSYLYKSLSGPELLRMHSFTRKVAQLLDESLGSYRCIQVMEGFETEHAHLKLFPVYKGKKYEHSYEGEERARDEDLEVVMKKIVK